MGKTCEYPNIISPHIELKMADSLRTGLCFVYFYDLYTNVTMETPYLWSIIKYKGMLHRIWNIKELIC